jgi:rubrerythrin
MSISSNPEVLNIMMNMREIEGQAGEKEMITEQSNTIRALQTAIQMEIDGKQYYQKASQTSQNVMGQKLFESLAAEEDIHLRRCKEIYRSIQESNRWPSVIDLPPGKIRISTFITALVPDIQNSSSELEAIQTAMAMENKTRDFYERQAEASSYEIEKKYYNALAGEERSHHALLLDYFELLNDPGQYFTMKERHSLDGG